VTFRAAKLGKAAASLLFKAVSSSLEKACRLLLVFVAAPALGPASFGAFQYASTVAGLLTLCTEFGLGTWTTRALARDAEGGGGIVAAGFRFRMAAVVPYVLLLVSFALAQAPGEARRVCLLLGVAALAGSFVDYIGAILRGYEDFRREAAANALRGVLTVAGALGALHLLGSLVGFASGLTAGAVASAGLGLWLLRRHARTRPVSAGVGSLGSVRSAFDDKTPQVALGEAIPMWLAGLLSTLFFRCDVVLVRYFSGDAEVGAYGAAYRVFEAATLLPSIIMAVAFPRLARAHGAASSSPWRWTGLEGRLVVLLAGLGMIMGMVMFAGSARFTGWVFGSGFARSAISLRVLALDVPVLFLNYALAPFLIARGRERTYLVFAAMLLVLNVSVNLVAVPRMGGPGAAWATLATDVARALGCIAVLGAGASARSTMR
jgi:O-antigen/teichoic acid export membrane protein